MASFLPIFLTAALFTQASCASPDQAKYVDILTQLTYPSAEWSATDFGEFPNAEELELLKKHAPSIWVSKDDCGPMNFYGQFVPWLYSDTESLGQIKGSRESLKKYERDFSVKWRLSRDPECMSSESPPLYAYTWQESLNFGDRTETIRVLKFALSFYKSGLPAKQAFLHKLGWVLGDRSKWHYLDIHGSVFYLLDQKNRLFSVVLAQHNHFRSYIIGKDIDLKTAMSICYSSRSNEPYFCADRKSVYPTAPTFREMEWIIAGRNRPFLGAWDIVPEPQARRAVNYIIEPLSSRDPLVTSWNALGPNIKIWGLFSTFFRNSPPGMAIFNLPEIKEVGKTAQAYYFDKNDSEVFEIHRNNTEDFFAAKMTTVLEINSQRYIEALREAGWFKP